jgi:anti-sigma factor RsiW
MKATIQPSARCRTFLLELSRYLDGDLPPARRRAVARHLDRCLGCGTVVSRLRKTMEACQAEGQRQPPRTVMSRAAKRARTLIDRGSS